MSQIWIENRVVPVTVISAEPNEVILVRTLDKDGYEGAQLSFKKTKKEFRGAEQLKPGDKIGVDIFKEGDVVRVSGISKGRGFQGVVKRHGFRGGPKTHGQKNRHRAPGSIGSTAFQRVVPGRRMAGHMGMDRVTVKNLELVRIEPENNLLFVKGAVPGMRGGILEIKKIGNKIKTGKA